MKIVERQVGDVVILDLHGKILIGEGDDALREAVTKLADSGQTKILLNLAEVPYVDSAGLGEIVRTYTTVSRKGGKLKLLNLTKKIEDLLSITKLADSGKTKILLNLAEVPYVDSAGLGEIVRTYTTVSRKGGKLKLLNLTKKIEDLLSITKLLTVFETYESEDEAVRSYQS